MYNCNQIVGADKAALYHELTRLRNSMGALVSRLENMRANESLDRQDLEAELEQAILAGTEAVKSSLAVIQKEEGLQMINGVRNSIQERLDAAADEG